MNDKRGPSPEEELDAYIDALNAEASPERFELDGTADLARVARAVKRLKDGAAADPDEAFADTLKRHVAGSRQQTVRQPARRRAPRWGMVAAVAVIAIIVAMLPALRGQDIAAAMASAVGKLTSYHGTIEVTMVSAAGDQQLVRTGEVWVDNDRYAVKNQDGTVTVNDGSRKWQVRPADKVVALLPAVPDPQRLALDLRAEGEQANAYPHKVAGREQVAGRSAVILAVTPPGGDTYRIWVDEQTHMPLRLETAMQNAIQTVITYTDLEINVALASAPFGFSVPAGYREVAEDPGQEVQTVAEAAARVGFQPIIPAQLPDRMIAHESRLVLDYGNTVITEQRAAGQFELRPGASLGSAAGGRLEVTADGLRWWQSGIEISISGPARETLGRLIAADLALPAAGGFPRQPAVTVPVNMEIAGNDQRQVDAGHSPWQIDPEMVAMAFLNEKLGPETIPYEAQQLEMNNGTHAIVSVSSGPYARIYMQKLVRQDATGIWSVVGYDPR
ncbi:MAG: LolA family protein [Chloroflexota bacterium]